MKGFAWGMGVLALAAAGWCAEPARHVVVKLSDTAPRLDGKLDDPQWAEAATATDFADIKTGKPAGNQTVVRVFMTRDGLYFGATLFDADPAKLVGQPQERDRQVWADDEFEIFLYPTRREGEYYQFLMNPWGSREDWHGPKDVEWNAVPDWQVATSKDDKAWYAEAFIPFAAIVKEPPRQGQVWWLRLCRADQQHDQNRQTAALSAWVLPPGGSFNAPGANGELVFVDRNLVVNGSFEDGPAEGVPQGWRLTVDHPDKNAGEVLWDETQATHGRRAVVLHGWHKRAGPDDAGAQANLLSLSQTLALQPSRVYRLTADVRLFGESVRGHGTFLGLGSRTLRLQPSEKAQTVSLNYAAPPAGERAVLRFLMWGWNPDTDTRVAIDNVSVCEAPETLEEGVICLTGNSTQHPERNRRVAGVYSLFNGGTTSFDAHAFVMKMADTSPVVDRMTEAWLHGNAVPFDQGVLTNGEADELLIADRSAPGATKYQHAWADSSMGGTVVFDLAKEYALERVRVHPSKISISADLFLKAEQGATFVHVARGEGNGVLELECASMRARWVAVTARTWGLNEVEI